MRSSLPACMHACPHAHQPTCPNAPPAQLPPPPAPPYPHRQQAREEGELIRAKALQEAADQAAKEAATRAGLQQANRDTRRANEVLQGFKAREKEAEAQLEREIEGMRGGGVGVGGAVAVCR